MNLNELIRLYELEKRLTDSPTTISARRYKLAQLVALFEGRPLDRSGLLEYLFSREGDQNS